MKIISSNSLENLAKNISHKIANSQKNLFEKDLIIVQSQGMAKWLNLQLAQNNGISAQVEFPFIKGFIVRCLKKIGYLKDNTLWERGTLTWRIYHLLPSIEDHEEYGSVLKDYINGDEARRHQLAQQISSLFDEYMIYRPQWLSRWEKNLDAVDKSGSPLVLGPHQAWQKALWQLLSHEAGDDSFHKALARFNDPSQELDLSPLKLPPSLAIFGITNIPPQFIQFFNRIAATGLDVSLYYLSPCREYWADLKSKNNSKFLRESNSESPDLAHSLLKSWGLLGRDFLNLLIDYTEFDEEDIYAIPDERQDPNNLPTLNRIQEGILNLREAFDTKLKDDGSMTINSCHSPLRELEVLQDHLRQLMQNDKSLQARDIIVICPDVAKYAPYIKPVFDDENWDQNKALQKAASTESQSLFPDEQVTNSIKVPNYKIPYSITDRSLANESQIIATYQKILALPKGRLTANEMIDIIESPAVLQQFSMTLEDLPQLREWIEKAAIRWGENAQSRKELFDLENFGQNSWEFGLDRLLGGYAFDDQGLYEDSLILPVASNGILLGNFKVLIEKLFCARKELQKKQTPREWILLLQQILDDFFFPDYETSSERDMIRKAIYSLEDAFNISKINERLKPESIILELTETLKSEIGSHGFMDRGVTFCQLLPMRSIPAKVVCILGMNEGEFPRQDRRSGFDLMEKNWAQGDRSGRLDDRYIFLEALLAAKDHFYISYKGMSEKDNSPIPPSIIVAELIEFLNLAGEKTFPVTNHPLQAFSSRYFDGNNNPKLQSFSHKSFCENQALLNRQNQERNFCEDSIELPDFLKTNTDGIVQIHIDDLAAFYKNPAAAFLKNQLNTNLRTNAESELPEDEAFDAPEGLERYLFREDIFNAIAKEYRDADISLIKEAIPQDFLEVMTLYQKTLLKHTCAQGHLPYGELGERIFHENYSAMRAFYEQIFLAQKKSTGNNYQIELEFMIGGQTIQLLGDVDRVFDNTYLPYRIGDLKFKYLFGPTIKYLALIAQEPSNQRHMSYFYWKDKTEKRQANSITHKQAKQFLECFINHYLDGHSKALPFFPDSFEAFTNAGPSYKLAELEKSMAPIYKKIRKNMGSDLSNAEVADIAYHWDSSKNIGLTERQSENLCAYSGKRKHIENNMDDYSTREQAAINKWQNAGFGNFSPESQDEAFLTCFGAEFPCEAIEVFKEFEPIFNAIWSSQEEN